MNASLDLGGMWQLAGWTMLHFLWIGAVAGVLGAALRIACRRAAPGVRYAVSLGTLALIAALPVGIAGWLAAQPRALPGDSSVAAIESPAIPGRSPGLSVVRDPVVVDLAKTPMVAAPMPSTQQQQTTALRSVATGDRTRLLPSLPGRGTIDAAVAYLPWVWIVGAPLTFVLLAAGLVGSKRMRAASKLLDSGPAVEACARLRSLMHITRRVVVAVSDAVAQPVLVGIVRPTILLPAAALSGWSPEELEMVLLHELAHVRRWDNLVNLVQRIVESLLFFHPAVWLASRQVRRDREECCDAAVVRHTARPEAYASLLVSIAAWKQRTQPAEAGLALASAMADHPLAGRIRRILKLEDESMRISRSTLGVALAFTGLLIATALTLPSSLVKADEEKPADKSIRAAAQDVKETAPINNRREAVSVTYFIQRDAVKQMQPFVEKNYKKFGLQAYEWSSDYQTIRVRAAEADQLRFGKLLVEKDWDDSPRSMRMELPDRARKSDNELKRLVDLLKAQGFNATVSTTITDGEPKKSLVVNLPYGGDWKPVWETRLEGDKPVAVVRMVRRDVRFHDPAAPQAAQGYATVTQPSAAPVAPSALPAGRKLQPGDRVHLDVVGAFPDYPLTEVYQIEPEGTLALGASYGRVPVAGHTVLEAEDLIKMQLSKVLTDVEVQLVLKEPARDVLIPATAAPWPTTASYGPAPAPTSATGWTAPALAEVRPTPVPTRNDYNAPVAPPLTARISPLDVKKNAKEAEIEEKLGVPVQVNFVDTPLADAVSLLSDTAKVNIYIDPRGIDEEALTIDVPVSLVLPNEISVKSALKLVLEPLRLTFVVEDEVVKITSEKRVIKKTTTFESSNGDNLRYFYHDGSKAPKPASNVPASALPAATKSAPSTAPTPTSSATTPTAAPPDAGQTTRFLYDGKEFAQWRSLWQEELKTEKRMEAIEALAAFGRAGYGREAVEAVFDVAGQYDFSTMDRSAEGKLKSRVIELLTKYGATRLPEALWLPVLEQRLNAEPARWKMLTYWLLGSLQTSDAAVMERLFELAKSEDDDVRAGAIAAIAKSDRKREDPRIIEMADKFLGSSDPGEIVTGVMLLEYSPEGNSVNSQLRFRPALVDALFFADDNVRQVARRALKKIDEKEAATIVEQLLARLKESEAKEERLAALRAIAALGPKAAAAESALAALIENYNDLELAAAAAVAVDRIHDGETKDGTVAHPGRDLYFKRIHALGGEKEMTRGNYLFSKESSDVNNSLRNVNLGGGGGFF